MDYKKINNITHDLIRIIGNLNILENDLIDKKMKKHLRALEIELLDIKTNILQCLLEKEK